MRKNRRYKIYEREKEKLRRANLPPEEYTRRIRELTRKLKI